MTHARVTRSRAAASALTPARVLGSLLLGGALVFAAGQAVQAAGPAPASAPAAKTSPCDEGTCPMRGGEHGRKGDHHGHGMKGGPGMGLPFAGPGFDRLLDDVQASDAQRKQIQGIVDKARVDLRALHEKARDQHQDAMAIWTAPKIDAAEAEKQRQQMLAQHDQVSKRVMQAMLDVGQVLTPEQRAKAAVALKQRHERMQDRLADRKERREEARGGREGGEERLQNHMLRRSTPPAPAAASQPTPSR
jgi:periplasmic protein CpxP/Spy